MVQKKLHELGIYFWRIPPPWGVIAVKVATEWRVTAASVYTLEQVSLVTPVAVKPVHR